MKWDPGHQSRDVEDRRGQGGGGGSGLPLGFLLSLLFRTKYSWIILLLVVGVYAVQRFVIAPRQHGGSGVAQQTAGDDRDAHFVGFVLDDAQQFWDVELPKAKAPYRHAKLVLFTDSTDTACGLGDAATGPFYCPPDEQVYIDLGFFRVMSERLGARGEFARAYVIAHEIGHHVQKITGTDRGKSAAKGASGGSVRLELQADCYAGMWARSANDRKLLEAGDLESALNAAARIGDDVLQSKGTGRVRPESFTHGTAQQRYTWLKRGFDTASFAQCDTFSAPTL